MTANELADCVNLTEMMDLKQEIRDFSNGTSSGEKKMVSLDYEQYVKCR